MNTIHPVPCADIHRLYMERPASIAHYSLGQWFAEANAEGIPYPQKLALIHSVTVDRGLQQIVDMKLNTLSLDRLSIFNMSHSGY